MNKIEIQNLTKRFGETTALDDISLCFEEKKIYGLLGRNGAGKSTLLNAIANRIFPDEGTVTVDGEPGMENDRAQGKIYLMSERDYYPKEFRVKDVFRWTKEFYAGFDLERAYELAGVFGLDTKKRISKLSTGYSSIYKNVVSLSLDTPYLLLDEPVLGLDANHRDLFYKLLIESYAENPRTVVISTHLIEEVSKLIEEVVIIKSGKIIENTSCEALLSSGYTLTGPAKEVDLFAVDKNKIGEDTVGGLKSVYVLGALNRAEVPENIEITALDLQKLFIQLTNA